MNEPGRNRAHSRKGADITGPHHPTKTYRANPARRRQWLHRLALDKRISAGARSWALLIAVRSDDAGKPTWGRQTRQADDLGRSDRSVRRYRAELEDLGYVITDRARPQRAPDGTYCRRHTNRYRMTFPGRNAPPEGTHRHPGSPQDPGRPGPAPNGGCSPGRPPNSPGAPPRHLPDTLDRLNPPTGWETAPDPGEGWSAPPPGTGKRHFDALRAALRRT